MTSYNTATLNIQNNIKKNVDKEFTFFSLYPQDTKEIIRKTAKF